MSRVRTSPVQRSLVLGLAALTLCACSTFRAKAPPPAPAAPLASPPPAAAPAPPPPAVAPRASCVPRNLARPPKYPDTDAALREAGGAADRYQLMAAGRLLRMQRLAELERILEGCR